MIVTLLWLTVSTPFVFKAQQEQKKEARGQSKQSDNTNPFSNTTEEKNESSVSTLSEYLHEAHVIEHGYTIIEKFEKCHAEDLYFAYHPELISPPPDAILA